MARYDKDIFKTYLQDAMGFLSKIENRTEF